MDQADFAKRLRRELSRRGLPLTRNEVQKVVTAVWPAARWDPSATFWAERLARAGLASHLVSSMLPQRAKDWQ